MATPDAPAIDHPPFEEEPPAPPADEDVVVPGEEEPLEPVGSNAKMPPIMDPDGTIEELQDRSMPIERVLWAVTRQGNRVEKTYMQKGLKWFHKIELYGILGQAVKVVLESDNLFNLNSLINAVQDPRQALSDALGRDGAPPSEDDDEKEGVDAARMMAAFAQVVAISPQLLRQAYCVILAIPDEWRDWAIKGAFPNMDDEMGQDILHAFVDQNWGVMEDFFVHEMPKIARRVVKEHRKRSAGRR